MKQTRKNHLPSFVYLATVKIMNRDQITDRRKMKEFSRLLTETVGMKPNGKAQIDALPCGIEGIHSFSVNQPLITSIQSIDTWPEKLDNGAIKVLIHSCVKFDKRLASATIKYFFKGSVIVKQRFFDDSYTEV